MADVLGGLTRTHYCGSLREAQVKAGMVILEPIMNVVVHAPAQYQGSLAGDINRRRGEILRDT